MNGANGAMRLFIIFALILSSGCDQRQNEVDMEGIIASLEKTDRLILNRIIVLEESHEKQQVDRKNFEESVLKRLENLESKVKSIESARKNESQESEMDDFAKIKNGIKSLREKLEGEEPELPDIDKFREDLKSLRENLKTFNENQKQSDGK